MDRRAYGTAMSEPGGYETAGGCEPVGCGWTGCPADCGCPSCRSWRTWGSVEYLFWWSKGRELPPLVTTGGTGVIGDPGVQVLFGDERVGTDPRGCRNGNRRQLSRRCQGVVAHRRCSGWRCSNAAKPGWNSRHFNRPGDVVHRRRRQHRTRLGLFSPRAKAPTHLILCDS